MKGFQGWKCSGFLNIQGSDVQWGARSNRLVVPLCRSCEFCCEKVDDTVKLAKLGKVGERVEGLATCVRSKVISGFGLWCLVPMAWGLPSVLGPCLLALAWRV
jgi:hypothetical protein